MKKVYIDKSKRKNSFLTNFTLVAICAFAIFITLAAVVISGRYHTEPTTPDIVLNSETSASAKSTSDNNLDFEHNIEIVEEIKADEEKEVTSESQVLFVPPCKGNVILGFSPVTPVYSETLEDWRPHNGIDIAVSLNSDVCAISDGVVENVVDDLRWGTTVIIDHGNNLRSFYSNLSPKVDTHVGDKIKKGDVIAHVGDTALFETVADTHLHFEMKINDAWVDPSNYFSLK